MIRCETSRLGAIPCLVSCLPQRMLHGNVKTFNMIFKKEWGVKLALEGSSLLISDQEHNFEPYLTKGHRQISKLLIAKLLIFKT